MKTRIRSLLLVTPLLLTLVTLVYFKGYELYYSEKFAGMFYDQKVEEFNKRLVVYEMLGRHDSVALAARVHTIESTDGEPGIYARILDENLHVISAASYDARHEVRLLEFMDPSHPDHERIGLLIREEVSGEFRVTVAGQQLRVHHWAWEIEGKTYYALIGVVPGILSKIVNMNYFTLGLVVLCLLTLVSVYSNIYLQSKHRIGLFKC
jgi:hypothetical protein